MTTYEIEPRFLLRGVAGSTAHGLARAHSDEDLHGVFGWTTEAYWHMSKPAESITGHEPQDYSYHEIEKFLKLALANNPTILELLFLDEYIEVDPAWGTTLVENREKFLHTGGVKNAYLGYAHSQFRKLVQRDGSFSSDTRNRTAKHARHLFRLLEQAESLLTTGTFSVKVKNPQWYFDLEELPVQDWVDMYYERDTDIRGIESVLPDQPDREWADSFLYEYRKGN